MMDMKEIAKLQKLKDSMAVSEVSAVENRDTDKGKVENVNSNKINYNVKERNVNDINRTQRQSIREVRRRDIWYADLGSNRKGSLQSGIRPIIIMSNQLNNRYCSNVNVVAITSKLDKTPLPVHTNIQGFGLRQESVVLGETIESIDKSQLLSYIGTVDEVSMKRIELAVKIQLSELKPKSNFERLDNEKQKYILDKLNIIKECNTVLKFLTRVNGSKKDIDIAEDEKFEAENALMAFCYNNSLNCDEFYTQENGINRELIAL